MSKGFEVITFRGEPIREFETLEEAKSYCRKHAA